MSGLERSGPGAIDWATVLRWGRWGNRGGWWLNRALLPAKTQRPLMLQAPGPLIQLGDRVKGQSLVRQRLAQGGVDSWLLLSVKGAPALQRHHLAMDEWAHTPIHTSSLCTNVTSNNAQKNAKNTQSHHHQHLTIVLWSLFSSLLSSHVLNNKRHS